MRCACLIVLLLAAVPPLAADEPERPITVDDVLREESESTVRYVGTFRARATYPQEISGGLGVIRARLPRLWDCATTCNFRGVTLQFEPGLAGLQVGAGYAQLLGEQRHNRFFVADTQLAFGVKGVLLRTWGRANLTPPDQTHAGVEFAFTVTRIHFSVGFLRRIDDGPGHDWLATAGMGWGF